MVHTYYYGATSRPRPWPSVLGPPATTTIVRYTAKRSVSKPVIPASRFTGWGTRENATLVTTQGQPGNKRLVIVRTERGSSQRSLIFRLKWAKRFVWRFALICTSLTRPTPDCISCW